MKPREDKINIFETIDTEEKAYWLGILMADGSIAWNQKTKKVYGIKFGLCDIDIMDKFKEFMGIRKETPYQILNQEKCQPVYYIYISSNKMAEDLGRHGMVPRKTHIINIPLINKDLLRHFIRGYFDGDGCIYIRNRKRKNGFSSEKFISITSCSVEILKQIEIIFKNNNLIRINKKYIKYPKTYNNKTHPPFIGFYRKSEVNNILNFIYLNSKVYMDRKYNLYLSIKNK